MKMKQFLFFFCFVLFLGVRAEEGMWIPALMEKQIFKEMKNGGLQLNPSAIYSENSTSIKDAIVLLGTCSAGIVSKDGLLLTNYHCAVRYILPLNSDTLSITNDGFWAKSQTREIPIKDLTAEVLVSAKEVTNIILLNVPDSLPESERSLRIKSNCEQLITDATKGTNYKASVESFFSGNQYFLFVKKVYTDVRMVGVPPERLNFGQYTDNWQWPRHTADFAFFRIYADKDNNPANFSATNQPFQPDYHLKISSKGVKKDDFTMVLGYPASTTEYLSSYAIKSIVDTYLPLSTELLQIKKRSIEQFTSSNEVERIKVSDMYASVNNLILKNEGYSTGFTKYLVKDKRQALEQSISQTDSSFDALLKEIENVYARMEAIEVAMKLYTDGLLSLDCIRLALRFKKLAESTDEKMFEQNCVKVKAQSKVFFDTYNHSIDSVISAGIFKKYKLLCSKTYWYPAFSKSSKTFTDNIEKVHYQSWLLDKNKVYTYLDKHSFACRKEILNDELYQQTISLYNYCINELVPMRNLFDQKLDSLNRKYIEYLLRHSKQNLYPDANYTLRIAYGSVKPYSTADAVFFDWQSTHTGLLEKQYKQTLMHDYVLDTTLKKLLLSADFGRYANQNGELPICFISNVHTSSGNSGSPVLNSQGEMVGLNMDRTIDATINDYYYSLSECRNISVDMRYILFLLEKFAPNKNIYNELDIN